MNRLSKETSPYLLQHAYNPVDWYPWGAEALQTAKNENKPILVSIGYAACHWCHVMERESFEDIETAALMNKHFVNIKIDREERPDLDAIYMEAVQLIAGNGGWPLNVFLTPDAKPFYGGTYFPPVPAFNRSSWRDVLLAISDAWQHRRQELISQAENLASHIGAGDFLKNLPTGTSVFSAAELEETTANLLKLADEQWGGFGQAPKFPQTFSILFLLRHYYFHKQQTRIATSEAFYKQNELAQKALQHALRSLDKMIYGGLYDQLAGGFARYATDRQWQVPHFEKMLYDNALLIATLSEAFQLTGKPLYRQVIEQTLQFVQTDWVSPEGGFYSAYDADSEGVEGKFYTWPKAEIEAVAGEKTALFCRYYEVTTEGNWDETNILWCTQSLEDFCRENEVSLLQTEADFREVRQALLQKRNKRSKPLLDNKVLLSWNALMITACCKAYAALGHEAYRQLAERAAAFIESRLKDETGYYHNYKGKATNPAFLDDLAFYIEALIHLQEVTASQTYLLTAKACLETVLTGFKDADSPFFFYTAAGQADVIVRKKEWYDGATPSGNSVMAANLHYLSTVFDRPEWKQQSVQMLEQLKAAVVKYPTSFAAAATGLQMVINGMYEISLNGAEAKQLLPQILQTYWPDKIIQTQLREDNRFSLFRGRWNTNGEAAIFLCKDEACSPPVSNIPALLALRNESSSPGF